MQRARYLCGVAVLCLAATSVREAAAQATTQTGLTPRAVLLGLTNAAGEGSGVSNVGAVIADFVGLEWRHPVGGRFQRHRLDDVVTYF